MELNAVDGAILIERNKTYVIEIPHSADKEMLHFYGDMLEKEYGARFLFLTDGARIARPDKTQVLNNLMEQIEDMKCGKPDGGCYGVNGEHCDILSEVIEMIKDEL